MMEEAGLESVGLTPGEASRWFQFDYSGYAKAIYDNPEALENLALLTSHNFYNGSAGHRWFSGTSNNGTDLLRSARPGLHAWVTSASWGNMDTDFAWQVFMNVRLAKVNGYIPWAVIQRPPEWVGGDPNPGTAFRVNEDGTYKVLPGYYWYKQMSRAGQPGMSVAYTECMDSELQLLGFGQNGTEQPDNFIVINSGVAATWRADAVDVIANERGFHFSNKDPKTNQKRGGKYEGTRAYSRQTEKGYLTEIIIPWENIGIKPQTGETVPFDVHVKEGAYSVAGQLGWHEEGKLQLGGENANEVEQIVRLQNVRMTLKADGEVEDAWAKVPAIAIDSVRHPNTRDYLQATWKALYDDQYLYLLVDVRDETNMQARRVAVKLEGADYQRFEAYRTSEDGEQYEYLGEFKAEEGIVTYEAPSRSVTTFFGVP
jgi:hypothetical protein